MSEFKKYYGKTLYHFEEKNNLGLFPTITPELGSDLVDFISDKHILDVQSLKSLSVFLEHAPLTLNYWNHFKSIYKILEKQLLSHSNESISGDIKKFERNFLVENLGIILYRLEHHDECLPCHTDQFKGKFWKKSCKNPCESWPGGVRYSERYLEYKSYIDGSQQTIDKKHLEKKIKRIEGVLEADIFVKEDILGEELIYLMLLTEKEDFSLDLQSFLLLSKASENNFLDTEGYGLPKFDDIRTYKSFDENSPWRKRRSHTIKQKENSNNKYRERYPDISGFFNKTKPEEATFNYMRRRCRRLLIKLQTINPEIYVRLSMHYLGKLKFPRTKNLSQLWLLNSIIFEKTEDIVHTRHGRGNLRYLNNFLSKTHNDFPCKDKWMMMFEEIIPYIELNSHYLCVTEFFVKIWNDSNNPYIENKLSIPISTYDCYLQSSSVSLVSFSFRQLLKTPELIKRLKPSSIARGLATIDASEASEYFDKIFTNYDELLEKNWIIRFIFDLDDAVHSLLVNSKTYSDRKKALELGLHSLRFPWPGVLSLKMSRRNISQFNSPFKFDNKIPVSIWNKNIWRVPNTSQIKNGLLGWHHAIFDKYLLDLSHDDFNGVAVKHFLKNANSERLLNLESLKIPYLRCHGKKLALKDAKEFNYPSDLKKKLLLIKGDMHLDSDGDLDNQKKDFLDSLSNMGYLSAKEGHFTTSDLRFEKCNLCESDRSNHEHFIPFINQNNDKAFKFRQDHYRDWSKKWGQSKTSFWTKIHKFNENFARYKCSNWLLEYILLELNQRIKMDTLEKNYERIVKKLIVKNIKEGNTNLLLKFLNKGIYVPENVVIDTLVNANHLTWKQDYLDGLNLPKDFIVSNLWIDAIWKRLGSRDAKIRNIVENRFINNKIFENDIIKHFAPRISSIKSQEQSNYLRKLIDCHPKIFLENPSYHLELCLSSDLEICDIAIRLKIQSGMDSAFALNLFESNSPLGEKYAIEYFNSIDSAHKDFKDNLMMICDSPNKYVREYGLGLLDKHDSQVNIANILLMLMENRHKNIRLYVAKMLVRNENKFINEEDFDLSILRTRNIERYTKELIKNKLSNQLNGNPSSSVKFLEVLKELSYGLIKSDKEWALKKLTLLNMLGINIPEIKIKNQEETDNENCASISTK